MPFWVDIFHDYYLPDLLHAAILAAILLCLLFGHTGLALLLLFPAYLARESTLLVAICLIFACWRRIRLQSAADRGAGDCYAPAWSAGTTARADLASVHGMSGGAYILGKLVWSFFKNVLGLPLWSNTLPECSPVWIKAIPGGLPSRRHSSIGLCQPSLWGPSRLLLAWFGIFGIGPALALALWRKMVSPPPRRINTSRESSSSSASASSTELISILMTPLLGASADRLVEYGWPFYFVVLPWFLSASYDLRGLRAAAIASAPPAYLLAGLVWLPAADPQLSVRRSGCFGLKWRGLRPDQAVSGRLAAGHSRR